MTGKEYDSMKTLSTQEVGTLLGCDRKYVNFLQDSDQLPYCKVGNKRKTLYTDVLAFINNGGEKMTRAEWRRKKKSGALA